MWGCDELGEWGKKKVGAEKDFHFEEGWNGKEGKETQTNYVVVKKVKKKIEQGWVLGGEKNQGENGKRVITGCSPRRKERGGGAEG